MSMKVLLKTPDFICKINYMQYKTCLFPLNMFLIGYLDINAFIDMY